MMREIESGSWQLAVGSWQLAVGYWQLATDVWHMVAGNWRVVAGDWEVDGGGGPSGFSFRSRMNIKSCGQTNHRLGFSDSSKLFFNKALFIFFSQHLLRNKI